MTRTLQALDAEWVTVSTAPAARRALDRWRSVEPALDVAELAELMDRRRTPEGAHAVLGALARLAPTDRLAARTLLQALVPGLGALARALGRGEEDVAAELVSLAWERIRTYPQQRSGSVAGNVLLDVRKAYWATSRTEHAPRNMAMPDVADSAEDIVIARQESELMRRIVDARDRGIVSDCAVRVIVRTRVAGDSLEEAAADEDLTVRNAVLRRWRGERALRRHLDALPLAG